MMLSEGESLNVGKNIEGNFLEIMVEGYGNFYMIILVIFFLDGEVFLCYFMVILIEWIFVKMIFFCGFFLKV